MPETTELTVASKESVALSLTYKIAAMESMSKDTATYRKKILDLYSECLTATKSRRKVSAD